MHVAGTCTDSELCTVPGLKSHPFISVLKSVLPEGGLFYLDSKEGKGKSEEEVHFPNCKTESELGLYSLDPGTVPVPEISARLANILPPPLPFGGNDSANQMVSCGKGFSFVFNGRKEPL